MKTIIKTIKSNLKLKSLEIRISKSIFRSSQRENDSDVWRLQSRLLTLREEYRYEHIAYCIMRGRKMLEIETSPLKEASKSKIKNILLRVFSEAEAQRILEESYKTA